ncbi:MAG: hypothetical protein HY619_00130 [Thaumarchaeota archaeon]|nr:hypothetical protein [Nitrososphaerota archaeon]
MNAADENIFVFYSVPAEFPEGTGLAVRLPDGFRRGVGMVVEKYCGGGNSFVRGSYSLYIMAGVSGFWKLKMIMLTLL